MKSKDTICPICGEYSFEFPDDYDICPICGWENDGVQRDQQDYWGGANSLSVNEARVVYSLLQNEETKNKVSKILDKFNLRNGEIHTQYMGIDHSTAEGDKCRKAFAEAHNDFIIDLELLMIYKRR